MVYFLPLFFAETFQDCDIELQLIVQCPLCDIDNAVLWRTPPDVGPGRPPDRFR